MTIEQTLYARSGACCELCGANNELSVYEVLPTSATSADTSILSCHTCQTQINDLSKVSPNHWRCLNDSMWSSVPAVQVVSWRMLNNLRHESWPNDLLDMLYLDDETLAWAKAGATETTDTETSIQHLDCNGAVLQAGDTVILVKTLNVKGSSFAAKRGTAVRRISLVHHNPEQIEGRVNGQQLVILTKFVKKSNN